MYVQGSTIGADWSGITKISSLPNNGTLVDLTIKVTKNATRSRLPFPLGTFVLMPALSLQILTSTTLMRATSSSLLPKSLTASVLVLSRFSAEKEVGIPFLQEFRLHLVPGLNIKSLQGEKANLWSSNRPFSAISHFQKFQKCQALSCSSYFSLLSYGS